MHRRSLSVSLAGLVTAALVSSLDAQPAPVLPAPRQVETLSSRTDPHRAGALVEVTRIQVDLGAATTRPPLDDATSPMTILGTRGSVAAGVEGVITVCEPLCGDSGEVCHHEARLAVGDLDRVGVPLAALPGSHVLSGYVGVPETPISVATTTDAVVSRFVTPIWADASSAGTRYRIRDTADGTVVLDYAWGTSGGQTMPAGPCVLSGRGPFTRMRCEGFEALLVDRQPLLVSVPDYNVAGVDVVTSFAHGGRRYFVVWLAVKTQSLYGLLYQEAGQWHARFHPRDYSLLC